MTQGEAYPGAVAVPIPEAEALAAVAVTAEVGAAGEGMVQIF